MVEILMSIPIGQEIVKTIGEDFKYDSFISTKGRLKRNGKGEWQSHLKDKVVTIKRIA